MENIQEIATKTAENLKELLVFLITRIQELETENAELKRAAESERARLSFGFASSLEGLLAVAHYG